MTKLNIIENASLSQLLGQPNRLLSGPEPAHGDWIRILRSYLRMTQVELAKRAKVAQSHLAAIESGKIDPQVGTLRRIFKAMSCDLSIQPRPARPLEEILRGRARSVALKRLKQTMGSMALEKQAPDPEAFRQLLEKRTNEILADKRGKLWAGEND
jgi:transcriptional regulator with XRE-family HTH domain